MPPDEPKYFQENQTLGKRTNIVRKVNRFMIQVIIYILYFMYDERLILRSLSPYIQLRF
jgi:hypothetical protein